MNSDDREDVIDLMELFHVLLRRWYLILICGFLGAAAAFGYTKLRVVPQYEASSMLYIFDKNSGIDLNLSKQLSADFPILVKSRPVLEKVIDDLKLDTSYEALAGTITFTNPSSSSIIKISVRNPDPELACEISNTMLDVTAEYIASVMLTDKPSTVEEAVVPTYPVSPNVKKNVMMGGMFGIVVMAGILVVLYLLDDRIKSEEDIERYLGLTTLASIPISRGEKKHKSKGKKAA